MYMYEISLIFNTNECKKMQQQFNYSLFGFTTIMNAFMTLKLP